MEVKKEKLLICMPDFPIPPRNNGITIRYFPILEYAASKFEIHLIVILKKKIDESLVDEAKKYCTKVTVYIREPKDVNLMVKIMNRVKAFVPFTIPFDFIAYDQRDISEFLIKETRGVHYNIALSVSLNTFYYVKRNVEADRHVLDIIDSPYSTKLRMLGKSIIDHYDCWMIKQWEGAWIKKADFACYISPLDRKIGAGRLAHSPKIGVIPNGLYIADHDVKCVNYGCRTIGFLGYMRYPPNIRAAQRLYTIFKSIHKELPDAKLVIIGRDPVPEIVKLAEDQSVIITGTVDNIWPYINGIDVFVFPMEIGSGQQNKVLEAMGAEKPVIASVLANSGIGAMDKQNIIEAGTDSEFGEAIVSLFRDSSLRSTIAQNAKKFVNSNYSWTSIYKLIDEKLLRTS